MQTHASLILRLVDRFGRRAVTAHEVSVFLGGHRGRTVWKPGGFFVLADLEPGRMQVELRSTRYQAESFPVDVPLPGAGYVLMHRMLNPAPAYPFGSPVTTLSGHLLLDGETVSGRPFHLVPGEGTEVLKVAEDGMEAGAVGLKLFAAVAAGRLSIPGHYLVFEREEAKREFCLIVQPADRNGLYLLQDGLSHAHPRGTPLVEVIEVRTAADGGFFCVLPDIRGKEARVELLLRETGRESVSVKLTVAAERPNDLGEISLGSGAVGKGK